MSFSVFFLFHIIENSFLLIASCRYVALSARYQSTFITGIREECGTAANVWRCALHFQRCRGSSQGSLQGEAPASLSLPSQTWIKVFVSCCCGLGRAPQRCLFFWETRRLAVTPRLSSATPRRHWHWNLLRGMNTSCVWTRQVHRAAMQSVADIGRNMVPFFLDLLCVVLQISQRGGWQSQSILMESHWAKHTWNTTVSRRTWPLCWRGWWTRWISCVRSPCSCFENCCGFSTRVTC